MSTEISGSSTMQEILGAYPSAQRALFQRYHVGGCSSCGFQPTDTLGDVCASHNILDVGEVIAHIKSSHEADQKVQVSPREVAQRLKSKEPFRLLDVRTPEEWHTAHIEGAELVTPELGQELMTSWAKDTAIVLHCHTGMRSLDAASFLIGHGFTNVKSLTGGIDAWSVEVDPSVPRY